MDYKVHAIDTTTVETVRQTRTSPGYGHPASVATAGGRGPCRLCLQPFRIGEEQRLLFTYDAFAGFEALPLPGPVFVHEQPCTRYPEDAGFPQALLQDRHTLNAYGAGRRLLDQVYVVGDETEPAVRALLTRPEVSYVHVRDTGAGCYDFAVSRA